MLRTSFLCHLVLLLILESRSGLKWKFFLSKLRLKLTKVRKAVLIGICLFLYSYWHIGVIRCNLVTRSSIEGNVPTEYCSLQGIFAFTWHWVLADGFLYWILTFPSAPLITFFSSIFIFWLCLHLALSVYIVYVQFWIRWYVQKLTSPVQGFDSQLVTKINAVII